MNLAFLTTTTVTPVLEGGLIPLTTIQRKYGCAIAPNGNSLYLNRVGYYKINASITFSAPEAGVVTVKLQKNDVDVPGITASSTITTADTEVRTVNLSGIVRVTCCEGISTLTLVNSGVDADIQNVSFDVEYLG